MTTRSSGATTPAYRAPNRFVRTRFVLLALLIGVASRAAQGQVVQTAPQTLLLTDSARVGQVRIFNPSRTSLDLRVDAVTTADNVVANNEGCDVVELFRFAPTRFRLAAGDTLILRVAATPPRRMLQQTCQAQLVVVARRAASTRLVMPDSNASFNDLGTTALSKVALTYRAVPPTAH